MPGRLPNHGFREGSGEGSEPRVPGQVPGLLGITPRLIVIILKWKYLFYFFISILFILLLFLVCFCYNNIYFIICL